MEICKNMNWIIEEQEFNKDNIYLNGSKYLLANGYMGYRGTLEEFSKSELVACTLSGVYDKVGNGWREPINAPNSFYTKLFCDSKPVDLLSINPIEHKQSLNIKNAVHNRKSIFKMADSNLIQINAQRFLSADSQHLSVMKYSFVCSEDCAITIETGINGDVWDMNGPHLTNISVEERNEVLILNSQTNELGYKISVAEAICIDCGTYTIEKSDYSILRKIVIEAKKNTHYNFVKCTAVFTTLDGDLDPTESAVEISKKALIEGYDSLFAKHILVWQRKWDRADVIIEGDENAQFALRYSMYQLMAIAPNNNSNGSIPARGLSGQVYKGAIFWDTEMFMIPFFTYTNPSVARNLLKYRCDKLAGARRKAVEYGYRGAFYAWESQDTGDDACTLFNIMDIHTNRPMRTYFRDRQIHVGADVVFALWQYYTITGDANIFLEGGAEVILECARFYFSYAYFKKDKNRYEILQVVGPDEYHERVDNNAFTNKMIKHTLETALNVLTLLKSEYNQSYLNLIAKIGFESDISNIIEMNELLYIKQPDSNNGIIEQFDRYLVLEKISLSDIKKRIIVPNEYLGGTNGLATTTQIIKQADVIMMLSVFKSDYSHEVKKANWNYYEPLTEHGSSLSHCAYAIVAADEGKIDWAYEYFMKTATTDLTGDAKQYLGSLYIGGTHPAANGGAWMTAVNGFGGISVNNGCLHINPKLPSNWDSLKFNINWKNQSLYIQIYQSKTVIISSKENLEHCKFLLYDKAVEVEIGQEITIENGNIKENIFKMVSGAIFDLDGVIVDTAKYHYLAWKRLADELGFDFTQNDNERLKGVSREASLDILLDIGNLVLSDKEKLFLAEKKNNWYVEYITKIDDSEILQGAKEYIERLKKDGVKIALASASKNAITILKNLKIIDLFDSIVDGNKVSKAKPHPEVFLLAAKELGLEPCKCIVFEDALAGIKGAKAANMKIIGIGNAELLWEADYVVEDLSKLIY